METGTRKRFERYERLFARALAGEVDVEAGSLPVR